MDLKKLLCEQKASLLTERGENMRINKELALDCPMAAQIMNSSSRKKTELIVRLAETQLKALGYKPQQFRSREDIKFVIEMMDRGFVSGCPVSSRKRKGNRGKAIKRILSGKERKEDPTVNVIPKETTKDGLPETVTDTNPAQKTSEEMDFKANYLDAVRSVLGDEEFGSITGDG